MEETTDLLWPDQGQLPGGSSLAERRSNAEKTIKRLFADIPQCTPHLTADRYYSTETLALFVLI